MVEIYPLFDTDIHLFASIHCFTYTYTQKERG